MINLTHKIIRLKNYAIEDSAYDTVKILISDKIRNPVVDAVYWPVGWQVTCSANIRLLPVK